MLFIYTIERIKFSQIIITFLLFCVMLTEKTVVSGLCLVLSLWYCIFFLFHGASKFNYVCFVCTLACNNLFEGYCTWLYIVLCHFDTLSRYTFFKEINVCSPKHCWSNLFINDNIPLKKKFMFNVCYIFCIVELLLY